MNWEMHVLPVYDMLITLYVVSYILLSPPDTLKTIPIHGYYLEEISGTQYPYM